MSWGATLDLTLDGAFVEIKPKDAAECFTDVEACVDTGVTVAMTVKIVRLEENMIYFSSGGERNDAYGWVVMYKYGELQVRLVMSIMADTKELRTPSST